MKIKLITPPEPYGIEIINRALGIRDAPPRSHYEIDGVEYWAVFFGIAYPTDSPGAVVSVGCLAEPEDPKMVVLDAINSEDGEPINTVMHLFEVANELRLRYRVNGGRIGTIVYGETDRFTELLVEFNKQFYEKADRHKMLIIGQPEGDETTESGLKYYSSIAEQMVGDRKRLVIGDHAGLKSELIAARNKTGKTAIDSYNPLIMALGFAVRSMLIQQPWKRPMQIYKAPVDKDAWFKGQEWWQKRRAEHPYGIRPAHKIIEGV